MAKVTKDARVAPAKFNAATRKGFLTALALTAFIWIVWAWFIRLLPPEIPLWYSLPYGSALLAGREWLVLIPGLTTVCIMLNLLLSGWWRSLSGSFLTLVAWLSVLMSGLMFIALIHIIILVL